MSRPLSSQLEDYLEAIDVLGQAGGTARVRDIALHVGVHKSTVTAALHNLSERGLVNYRPYGEITLTETGRDTAREVRRKHRVIRGFLVNVLGLDAGVADANACRLEHDFGPAAFHRLCLFSEFLEGKSSEGWDCFAEFAHFVSCRGEAPGVPPRSGGG